MIYQIFNKVRNQESKELNLSRLMNALKGLFSSIGIIYFFIIPVYIPIRAMGIELHSYENVINNPLDLILYFLQITMLLACNSILLNIIYDFISKRLKDDTLITHWYKLTAIFFSFLFIITSDFILKPDSLLMLYMASGAHYFIISFFQLLIRSEIKHNRNQQITSAQANNYFGVTLNVSGCIALAAFAWFYANKHVEYYADYCIFLEITLFIYLLLGRKYYSSIKILLKHYSYFRLMSRFLCAVIILFIAAFLSSLFMLSNWVGPLFLLIFIVRFYNQLKHVVNKRDLKLLINIAMGYGLILTVLTNSIFAFFMKNKGINLFNFAYSLEPIFSVVIGLIFTWILLNQNINTSRQTLAKNIFLLNCSIPLSLVLFTCIYIKKGVLLPLLVSMFGIYAIVEYLSLFYARQIAQQNEYNELQGAKITNYNSIILYGLCPALLYLMIYVLSKFTFLQSTSLLSATVFIYTILSIIGNFTLKFGEKYDIS